METDEMTQEHSQHLLENRYLTVSLRDELAGIHILNIREIIKTKNITCVPMMPEYILGVTNIRGAVIPVIELSKRLELRDSHQDAAMFNIVVVEIQDENDKQLIGIAIDGVNEVIEIEAKEMRKTPDFGTQIPTRYIEYMGQVESRFIPILKLSTILEIDELNTHEASLKLDFEDA